MRNWTFVRAASVLGVTCCILSSATRAAAGGLEYAGQGAQSLARGGAVTARAEDPMVLAHNPAGLAELRGTQLMLNLNLALFDACVDPAGFYGWGVYLGGKRSRFVDPITGEEETLALTEVDETGPEPVAVAADYYTGAYDTVCLDQHITPIPQLAWTMRITEKLGIGFGFIFPAVQPGGAWGGKHGIIRGESGDLRPAATRYQMLSSANLGVFPNLGVGYRILDMLRVGLAFEWGVIAVNNFTMAAASGGTTPSADFMAHVKGQDWFIPALTASVHFVPTDALDVVAAFRWQDDINATGTADLTSGLFDPAFNPHISNGVPILALKQNMPWKLRAGVRYADRLAPRPTGTGADESDISSGERIHDPLEDERWDVELDVEYQVNGRNTEQFVDFEDGYRIEFSPVVPTATAPSASVPSDITIQKQWQDQVSVRLGGTYNVLPGRVGLSAGTHYETRGVNPDYMQVDFWPVSRIGVHGGVLVRISNAVDFVLSYAHIFQEEIIVAPPAHRERGLIYADFEQGAPVREIDKTVGVLVDRRGNGLQVIEAPSQGTPDGTARLQQNVTVTSAGQPPYITNAGRYYSNFDILAAGINVHF